MYNEVIPQTARVTTVQLSSCVQNYDLIWQLFIMWEQRVCLQDSNESSYIYCEIRLWHSTLCDRVVADVCGFPVIFPQLFNDAYRLDLYWLISLFSDLLFK